MTEDEKKVPLKEAIAQVEVGWARLALLHLSFSKTLIDEFGEEKGKELIIKTMIDYSKRVVKRIKNGAQRLPWYGLHDKYVYSGNEYINNHEIPGFLEEGFDWSVFKNYGCVVAKVSKEFEEEELGCLYCYADPGIAMAADPSYKFIHEKCEACGDEYCTFKVLPTTEKERKDFKNSDREWKHVDPPLVKGARLE
jgi:hypothetical protein